jgi:DNA-binding NarL/FixJ family response regulator/class 3 adenylate cyclase
VVGTDRQIGLNRRLAVILFTDLVRSTEVFSRLPVDHAEELRQAHFATLRELVEAHHGEVVKTLGDGIMARFGLATQALDCAVAAQQRLSLKQGHVSLAGIRAGVSAGEVSWDGGDCHGPAVVEAARLCALAKPGRVFAARVVRLLVGPGPAHAFAELGSHTLKGLPGEVQVDEVLWTPPEAAAPRVLLADDAVVVRHGLARVLEDAGCHVVGQASDPDQLLQLTAELLPDVVVTDIRMPPLFKLEGLEAALEIRRRFPQVGVLVLSQHLETEYATDLLAGDAGGVGYLLKERIGAVDTFTDAVRRVGAGGTAIDPEIVAVLMGRERAGTPVGSLSELDRDILAMLAQGLSSVGIGQRLAIDTEIVESHLADVFATLGLPAERDDDRRTQSVVRYFEATR